MQRETERITHAFLAQRFLTPLRFGYSSARVLVRKGVQSTRCPMAEPQNPLNSANPRAGGAAFVTHFMPGLIIGLLVGGLAGAFLPVLLERDGIPSSGTKTTGPATPVPRDPQDPRETQQPPAEPETPAGETPATDTSAPGTQAPTTPPPPAEPVTTPAKPK
jgi:hypothetical protein